MADTRDLETRIKLAEKSLNAAFGIQPNQEGEGANRFLDLESLASAYKEEASRKEVAKQFLSIAKSIRSMRSSYLPIDFFINNETGLFDADIANMVASEESYENAFMRMLGMPSIGLSEFGLTPEDSEIRSSEKLKRVDPQTGSVIESSFEEIKNFILNERQKPKTSRKILIDDSIYNISESSGSTSISNTISIRNLTLEEIADLFNTIIVDGKLIDPSTAETATFIPTEITRNSETEPFINPYNDMAIPTSNIDIITNQASVDEIKATILNIEQDVWKFSYLLIPPIQNIETSKCINEPSKIISPPFSNIRNQTINDNLIRPTLLESIIRIRLDKVSGTDTFVSNDNIEEGFFEASINLPNQDTNVEVIPDNYGVLESLFILRLRSSISGIAQKLFADIDILINEMEKARRVPVAENIETGQIINNYSNESAKQIKNIESLSEEDDINEQSLNFLQQQKLIEDSILFLLGDRSEVLDLQSQTQRSSSIYNSHMMSGLIDIIDIPRKRIESEINKINDSRNQNVSNIIEQKTQEVDLVLGTDIGIGTIDLAVFSLALFTLSEKSLLGLLSLSQYERIKNGEFKSLIPEEGDKEDTVVALNELTQLIIEGYQIFIDELKKDDRIR